MEKAKDHVASSEAFRFNLFHFIFSAFHWNPNKVAYPITQLIIIFFSKTK